MYKWEPSEDKKIEMKNHANITKGIDSDKKHMITKNHHIEDWSFYEASAENNKQSC